MLLLTFCAKSAQMYTLFYPIVLPMPMIMPDWIYLSEVLKHFSKQAFVYIRNSIFWLRGTLINHYLAVIKTMSANDHARLDISVRGFETLFKTSICSHKDIQSSG